ncbi:small ubiquitin-related modifier 1 [Medicago truncatula]|nr:small ubiquitin-related modifier 1 [Medicago truncatula]
MASNGILGNKRKASERDEVTEDGIVHIEFGIRGQDGNEQHFKVNQDKFLITAFQQYCKKMKLQYATINFLLDEKSIQGNRQTPKMLNLKNGDTIDAMKHQSGGGVVAM